jgi:hypothetical protein
LRSVRSAARRRRQRANAPLNPYNWRDAARTAVQPRRGDALNAARRAPSAARTTGCAHRAQHPLPPGSGRATKVEAAARTVGRVGTGVAHLARHRRRSGARGYIVAGLGMRRPSRDGARPPSGTCSSRSKVRRCGCAWLRRTIGSSTFPTSKELVEQRGHPWVRIPTHESVARGRPRIDLGGPRDSERRSFWADRAR